MHTLLASLQLRNHINIQNTRTIHLMILFRFLLCVAEQNKGFDYGLSGTQGHYKHYIIFERNHVFITFSDTGGLTIT